MPRLRASSGTLTAEERRLQGEADDWRRTALARTRASARGWLTATASVSGLVALTAAFQGPEDVRALVDWARGTAGVLLALTVLAVILAIMLATSAAEGGVHTSATTAAGVDQRERDELTSAVRLLRLSRIATAAAVALLLATVVVIWWAPTRSGGRLVVTDRDGRSVCLPKSAAGAPGYLLDVTTVQEVRTAESCADLVAPPRR